MENRYDKYKDSGIAWIGEIPEHWELRKGKNLFKLRNSKGNNNAILLAATQKYGMIPQSQVEGVVQVKQNTDLNTFKTVHKNDYVISLRSFQGGFEMSEYEGVCSPAYQVFYSTKPCCNYFFKYMFKSYGFVSQINAFTLGIREGKNIQYEDFSLMKLPLPTIQEQQSIATYLDQKCSEIDELITLQEEMITKLQSYKQSVITEAVTKGLDKNVPLKDSGIEWIGEIPEHWEVKRLKFSCNVFGRIGFRGYKSDDLVSEGNGAITLSPSNMKDMKMDYTNRTYLSWKKYYESPEIMISKNDILMVKTGSTYGKCSFVDDIPMECTINPQIVVFKQHKDYPKFLAYSFQTKATRAFVETSVVGGTIPTIAQEKIMNYFFAFPPLSEQQSIATYLDQKCSEIDALISIKQQKIEKLKDYKKSLIFECVTGKRKVS
jgi:type I restriction enzyme S subunit